MSTRNTRTRKTSDTRQTAAVEKARPTGADMDRMQLRRLGMVAAVMTICMVAVLGTSVYLQGCEHEAFLKEAERNYLRMMTLDTQRGDIYDRNGEALATPVEVDPVYANPRKVVDPVSTATKLALSLDNTGYDDLYSRLTAPAHFRYIKRQISAKESRDVSRLKLPGVMISREAKRFYPKKELAGQLLGVVGFDSKGQEGLEATFDKLLRGGTVKAAYHRDAQGRYAMLESLPPVETRAGHALQISLDEKIQAIAEQELERAVVSSYALSGVAVVMDVPTGDVLAMAHYPRFNPNLYREQIAQDKAAHARGEERVMRVRNRAIADQFEPGSTFKMFTLAAGLEERVVGLEDKIDTSGGRMKVHKKWISDTHRFSEPKNVSTLVKYSSNVGFIKIGQLLGRDRLWSYLRSFGFGQPTGTGIHGEHGGLLRPPRQWADITLANISFGQGVAVTALQLTSAMAALGNGGVLMEPRVVIAELDADGRKIKAFPPKPVRRVVSKATAREVIQALERVVEHDGTGRHAWLYDYDVAGKTGTAQKPDTIAGGYAEDRWVASFMGLVPAQKPRLAILVAVDEPQGLYYGGHVAAPAFKAIADWTLNYLAVPPSYGARERVRAEYVKEPGQPDVTAEGAYYDYPAERQPGVDPNEPSEVVVPDFGEMSIRQAVRFAHRHYLSLDVDGTGRAAGQSHKPGSVVLPWERVTVYFRPSGGGAL